MGNYQLLHLALSEMGEDEVPPEAVGIPITLPAVVCGSLSDQTLFRISQMRGKMAHGDDEDASDRHPKLDTGGTMVRLSSSFRKARVRWFLYILEVCSRSTEQLLKQ